MLSIMYAYFKTFHFPLNIFTYIVCICITTESNKDIRLSKLVIFHSQKSLPNISSNRFTFKGGLLILCIISE